MKFLRALPSPVIVSNNHTHMDQVPEKKVPIEKADLASERDDGEQPT